MNEQNFQDALGELPEALLAPVERLRAKKRAVRWTRWAAMAACLCLAAGLALTWPGWRAASKHAEADRFPAEEMLQEAPMEDKTYGDILTDDSMSNTAHSSTTVPLMRGKVLEVRDGELLVQPLEDDPIRGSADRIIISLMGLKEVPVLAAGDLIRVGYSGQVLETYPAQIAEVYFLELLQPGGPANN